MDQSAPKTTGTVIYVGAITPESFRAPAEADFEIWWGNQMLNNNNKNNKNN